MDIGVIKESIVNIKEKLEDIRSDNLKKTNEINELEEEVIKMRSQVDNITTDLIRINSNVEKYTNLYLESKERIQQLENTPKCTKDEEIKKDLNSLQKRYEEDNKERKNNARQIKILVITVILTFILSISQFIFESVYTKNEKENEMLEKYIENEKSDLKEIKKLLENKLRR